MSPGTDLPGGQRAVEERQFIDCPAERADPLVDADGTDAHVLGGGERGLPGKPLLLAELKFPCRTS